jgi:hypothetical protein
VLTVFITNRDLLDAPRNLADRIAELGALPVILDNDSEHEETLDWYDHTDHPVVMLGKNLGSHAVWDCGEVLQAHLDEDFYLVTDGDLDISGVPNDVFDVMREHILLYPEFEKVGLSLEIDDLPDCNNDKDRIFDHESKFWSKKVGCGFEADIDATFCMYRAGTGWGGYRGIRLDRPYTAKHVPWYWDWDNLPDDARTYVARAEPQFSTWGTRMKGDR